MPCPSSFHPSRRALFLVVAQLCLFPALICGARPPSIVVIVADDLGHNDVAWNGSPQIPTPNINEIASTGTLLSRYYAQPVCSPSRASIMSARHVIHTGIYMPFDHGVTNEALNTSFTLLPRYLKLAAGYETAMVGKWHLGGNVMAALPTERGFDTHIGYLSGAEDHLIHEPNPGIYDFFSNGTTPEVRFNNTFSSHVFAAAAVEVIEAFNATGAATAPLFLYVAFQDVHWPLQAPQAYIYRFANATGGNSARQVVCAMAAFLDDAVGNVTAALKRRGMWDDTIVVFVSDNGGPTNGDEGTMSNNFPLRGGKNTLWEGGTRCLAAVRGPGVAAGAVSAQYVHATDLLPSLVSMASGGRPFTDFAPPGEPPYLPGDGLDVWASIASGGTAAPPPRTWVLLETHKDAAYETHGDGYIVGDMKLISWGPSTPRPEDGWFLPPGGSKSAPYTVKCSAGGKGGLPAAGPAPNQTACIFPTYCLFNISADPCEYEDLADQFPDIVASMRAQLAVYAATSVPPIVGQGCMPNIVNIAGTSGETTTYQPCDAPPLPPVAPAA